MIKNLVGMNQLVENKVISEMEVATIDKRSLGDIALDINTLKTMIVCDYMSTELKALNKRMRHINNTITKYKDAIMDIEETSKHRVPVGYNKEEEKQLVELNIKLKKAKDNAVVNRNKINSVEFFLESNKSHVDMLNDFYARINDSEDKLIQNELNIFNLCSAYLLGRSDLYDFTKFNVLAKFGQALREKLDTIPYEKDATTKIWDNDCKAIYKDYVKELTAVLIDDYKITKSMGDSKFFRTYTNNLDKAEKLKVLDLLKDVRFAECEKDGRIILCFTGLYENESNEVLLNSIIMKLQGNKLTSTNEGLKN